MDSPKSNLNWVAFRSIKFSPASREVSIDFSRNAGCWRVNASDNGARIPEELCFDVLSNFGQIAPADGKSRIKAGLGMAISQWVVDEHGGMIDFVSELGRNSDFFFDQPSKGRREPKTDISNDESLKIANNAQKADNDA